MKFSTILTLGCITVLAVVLTGCELIDQPVTKPSRKFGTELLISEVFTISPDKPYAYSWIELYNPTNTYKTTYQTTTPRTGYIAGYNGTLIRTDDDGLTWTSVAGAPYSGNINAMGWPWSDTGFSVNSGGQMFRMLHRSDGTFNYIDESYPAAAGISLNDLASQKQQPVVFIVGDNGTILRFLTRFRTWSSYGGVTGQNLHSIRWVRTDAIYAAGDSGTILKGTAGGNFKGQISPPSHVTVNYYGVSFSSDTGWVVGSKGKIAYTSNGGLSWRDQATPTTVTLRRVFVSDTASPANTAWAVGDNGVILKTVDYGESWVQMTSNTTANLYDIKMIDYNQGYALGEGGTIVRTFDGGQTWFRFPSPSTQRFTCSYFLPTNRYVFHFYQLSLWAQYHHFFRDPLTRVANKSVLTDTVLGVVKLVPNLRSFPGIIAPGEYLSFTNDRRKFDIHFRLRSTDPGPQMVPLMLDSVLVGKAFGAIGDSLIYVPDVYADSVLWSLPRSGEARLERYDLNLLVDPSNPNKPIIDTTRENSQTVVDLVRWGYFKAAAGVFSGEPSYSLNQPVGYIPESWSLSRYLDDVGGPVERSNTATSFYFSSVPTPGQNAQKHKPE